MMPAQPALFTEAYLNVPLPEFFALAPEPSWVANWRAFYGIDFQVKGLAVEQRLGAIHVAGYDVAVQVYRPASSVGTLIVLHGYYDHMGLYGHLFAWALQQGLTVLSCDLPGHGLSTGARASINEFAEYQSVLKALLIVAEQLALPTPWHLSGQSTGAAISLDYALHQPKLSEMGRLILLAPLVRPRAWRPSKWLYQGLRPFVQAIPRRQSNNSSDVDFLAFVQQDPLQAQRLPTAWVGALSRWIPTIEQASATAIKPIIVQGDEDQTVDWKHNLTVLGEKFQQPELCMLPGAGHHLVNEQEHYRQQGFSFIEKFL